MSDNFAHDSYHPPEVLNSPQGRPITDPDIRASILAQITDKEALYQENLSAEEQMAQRGESVFGGAVVATPEQAAAIDEAFKNATPEERAKYTAQQLAGVTDEATLDDSSKTPGLESHEDALKRSMENTNDSDGSGSTVEAVAKRVAAAEKPTSLEASLANVRLSTERQQRVVITGDEHVRRKFYEILASKGQVFYQGGTPIITASDRDIPKILKQAASEVPGAKVAHALQMEMNRDTPGIIGSLANRYNNVFGRKHEITVFAVGDEKQIAEKLEEVQKFVDKLQNEKVVPAGTVPRGASLLMGKEGDPDPHQPIELRNLSSLRDVLRHPLDKVAYYNAEQQEKAAARREFRDEKEDKNVADARAKEKEAASGDSPEASRPLHRRTAELAEQFDQQFVKPSLMVTDTGHGQSHALVMAFQAAKIADPAKHELSTLPDESRQKFIAQFAAVVEKVSDKEVDHLHKGKRSALPSLEMDNPRRDNTPSARSRLNDFIKMELERDDKFAEKLPALLKEMVSKEALTEAQATRITERVQAAALELKAASAETPAAEASAGATVAAPDAAKTPESAPTAVASESPEKAVDTSAPKATEAAPEKAEAVSGADPSPAPKSGDQAQLFPDAPATDKAAAQSPTESAGQPVTAAPASSVDAASAQPPTDAPAATDQAPVAPTGLQAKLADLASQEPSKVSPDAAMSVIATLDAKQSSPLSSLGIGEGDAATKSLARIEGLLEKAQAGVFGPEASAYAGPLKESLDNWKEQNLAAAMNAGKSPSAHADAMDAAKAGDPKWHDQVATAQKAEAAPTARLDSAQPTSTDAASVAPKDAPVTPQSDPVKEAQAAAAVLNLARTEASAGLLAGLLDSPAKYLTHRDKSWNEQGVNQMVDRVMSLDSDSVAKLSPGGAERAVMASVWLTSAAQDGKLPGFEGPEGAAKLDALKLKASELVNAVDGVLKPTAAVNDLFLNADKFADRMVAREKELALAAVQTRSELPMRDPTASASAATGADQARATHDMAKDLVHIAYRGMQPSQQQVKHMLKSAGKLTPQTLKGMDPATKAKAATALKTLVNEVRNGGLLGDFSKLPQGMKKIVAGAQEASDALHSGLSKDPAMKVELAKAHQELHGPTEKPGKEIDASAVKATDAPRPERNASSSMER